MCHVSRITCHFFSDNFAELACGGFFFIHGGFIFFRGGVCFYWLACWVRHEKDLVKFYIFFYHKKQKLTVQKGSNNSENMCCMGLREKTKYVLGLPGVSQVGLEHGKKPKDYDHQPADRGQRFNGFFLTAPLMEHFQKGKMKTHLNLSDDRRHQNIWFFSWSKC